MEEQKSSVPSSPSPVTPSGKPSGVSTGKLTPEEDPCTDRCRSKEHGRRIWEIAQGGSDIQVVALWSKTCLNYSQVKDDFGRTALHAASTNGKLKAVEWLIKTQQCNINQKDFISGYTPLHRSIYFGHFHVAKTLIKHGADVNIRDNEGLTSFELCQMDRPITFKQNPGDLTELTVWGSNANYNLGLGHQQPRLMPDVVEKFRKQGDLSLTKVEMNTYHTMFLTQSGKVFTCGYGMGGRLGTGEETSVLNPTAVHLKNECKILAVGQDHTIFLTDSKVWTVGSNEFGQLGQPNKCQRLLNPRSVDSLQKYGISGIVASGIHSIFFNDSVILMCGLNQGQFGRSIGNDANTPLNVYTPTNVSDRLPLDSVGSGVITTVAGNEHCTVVCVENRYLFLMRRYQQTRIDSRNTTSQEIFKIQATGEKNTITLFLLSSSGRVLVWREHYNKATNESKGAFTRLIFSNSRLLDVRDLSVNQSSLVVITSTGEAYKAGWNYNNPPVIVGRMEERYGQVADTDFQIAVRMRRGGGKQNTAACPMALELMKIRRVPNVHTGLYVSSDAKGHNFTILQRHQMMDVTDIPYVGLPTMADDIQHLYSMTGEEDGIQDVVFELGYERFPAHKFILASASSVMSNIFKETPSSPQGDPLCIKVTNRLFGVDPTKCASLEDAKMFKAVLDMIYKSKCFLISPEYLAELQACALHDGKKKGPLFTEKTKELTRMRNLFRLLSFDDGVSLIQDIISEADHRPGRLLELAQRRHTLSFCRDAETTFTDVVLQSSDKVLISAHKCILAARLEYFRSLFSMNWSQDRLSKKKNGPLSLPFSWKAISTLLDFVYTDNQNVINDAEFDLVWEILGASDYMMVERLTNIAESEMTKHICLKNVADIAAFASNHNAPQLQNSCFDFIALNMTAMLENKLLDCLAADVLEALGNYYRATQQRNLKFFRENRPCPQRPVQEEYEDAVARTTPEVLEQLEDIEESDGAIVVKKTSSKPARTRVRLRSRTLSDNETIHEHHDDRQDAMPLPTNSVVHAAKASGPLTVTPNKLAAPERKYIVPMPKNVIQSPPPTASSPLRRDEFPSLSDALATSPPQRVITSTPQAVPEPQGANKTLIFAKSNSVNKWNLPVQTSAAMAGSASLISTPSSGQRQPATPGGGAKKKTKWRTIQSDKDIGSGDAPPSGVSPPKVTLTADGRDRQNPWRVNSKAEVTFKDIVQDEVEKKINFQKATSKSLLLMQIEDEAINVLTERYTSEDTIDFIELLTIERVVSSNYCTPTWVQHPGAVTSPKSDPPLI